MTREEAMAVIMRLNIITTGAPSVWIEATIRIVQAGAKAEREACASFIENWKYAKECAGCDQPTPYQYAAAIRARGKL